jgi:predicted unusual protein kinase regulating ubiquinone biosynthesis (AarF/ABC1/UbiB family)
MITTYFIKIYFIFYRLLQLIGVSVFMVILATYFRLFYQNYQQILPILFRRYFEILGGSFIKAGQTLSMRYDVMPVMYCNELSKLLDKVKPFNKEKGLRIIKKAWRGKSDNFLKDYELELVASASLAQVYKGTTQSGESVAIKLKRPYITPILQADIFYLQLLNFLFFLTAYGTRLGVNDVLKELVEALKSEVDYKKEVLVMDTFYALSLEKQNFRAPKVYKDYCTHSVICMEYFEGVWLSEVLAHIRNNTLEEFRASHNFNYSLVELSERIFGILMYQIYDNSFFHADPHAGNIIILNNGEIGLVDFGIAGVFTEEDKRKQLNYLLALSIGDLDQAIEQFVCILEPTPQSKYTEIKQDFRVYLLKWIYANRSQSERVFEKTSGFLIMRSTALVKKYHFKFPKNVMLYYKSVFILEHVIFELNPSFDTVAQTSAFLEGNLQRSMQKKIIKESSYYQQYTLLENLLNLDKNLTDFLKSKKETPRQKRMDNLPLLLRMSIMVVVLLLLINILPTDFHFGLLSYMQKIGIGWLLLTGFLLAFYARRYFT